MPNRLASNTAAMRTLIATATLASAIALTALPALPNQAFATTSVLRCEMPDGTRLYTNKACASFGATSAPMDAAVLNRIKADHRREARRVAEQNGQDADAAVAAFDADRTVASAPSNRRPVSSGCAATPEQLASDLQASLAIGDVNRVAESFDWAGMRNDQAQQIFRQLERMSASQQVVDADYFEASISYGSVVSSNRGMMQLTFASAGGAGTSVDDYEVTRQQGCYFLRYA